MPRLLEQKRTCVVGNWICHKLMVKVFYHKLVEDLFICAFYNIF